MKVISTARTCQRTLVRHFGFREMRNIRTPAGGAASKGLMSTGSISLDLEFLIKGGDIAFLDFRD